MYQIFCFLAHDVDDHDVTGVARTRRTRQTNMTLSTDILYNLCLQMIRENVFLLTALSLYTKEERCVSRVVRVACYCLLVAGGELQRRGREVADVTPPILGRDDGRGEGPAVWGGRRDYNNSNTTSRPGSRCSFRLFGIRTLPRGFLLPDTEFGRGVWVPAVLWCPGSVTGVRGGWRRSRSGRAAGERAVQARRRGRAQRCTPGRLWGPALFAQLSGSRSLGQSRVTLALAATTRRNPAVSQCLSARWISFAMMTLELLRSTCPLLVSCARVSLPICCAVSREISSGEPPPALASGEDIIAWPCIGAPRELSEDRLWRPRCAKLVAEVKVSLALPPPRYLLDLPHHKYYSLLAPTTVCEGDISPRTRVTKQADDSVRSSTTNIIYSFPSYSCRRRRRVYLSKRLVCRALVFGIVIISNISNEDAATLVPKRLSLTLLAPDDDGSQRNSVEIRSHDNIELALGRPDRL
ncbi:hypothetical protein E2C01_022288 [Portunus trituberculatus]|uniref:Uncharacterized protein n=1 Tax=Portunus trituberculatus TaxID=210409 RepID=A0A5B7E509_PORTR|nr:hypothetical protein [Portunus trituberculatus]